MVWMLNHLWRHLLPSIMLRPNHGSLHPKSRQKRAQVVQGCKLWFTSNRNADHFELQVLELNHILTLQIHGKLSISARTDIIAQFKSSRRNGPRVLIISNVGLTGLNLPCTNILIIVVSNFCHAFSYAFISDARVGAFSNIGLSVVCHWRRPTDWTYLSHPPAKNRPRVSNCRCWHSGCLSE